MGKKAQGISEFGGSLNDFIDRVRSAFEAQFGREAGPPDGLGAWATDVFPSHVVARMGDRYFQVAMEVTEDAVSFAPRTEWQEVHLNYVAETLPAGPIRDVVAVWEFRGQYPEVSFAAGVDAKALTEGDPDPVFVTLPIGKVNALSGNQRFYDEKFVAELERQVLANKPIGLMGHLKPEDRATEFPAEAVHWVGARRVGELLWGKGYVPPGEARERLKRYKAAGKKIATSIDAIAEGVWDEAVRGYRMIADTLRLAQIDIAPADRAGIADLAAVPLLTSEMVLEPNHPEREDSMDRLQVIRELTAADARLLPDAVRTAILETVQAPPEVAQMEQLRQALGLDSKADVVSVVTEMRREQEQRGRELVSARIRELAADAEKGIQIAELRPMVIALVEARGPKTIDEAERHFAEIVASETVKTALAAHVKQAMGPNQGSGANTHNQSGEGRYFRIPKKEAA